MDSVFIYWDNSNIFIGAQYVAMEREGQGARSRVRIHFDHLLELARAERPIEHATAVGSVPPELRHVWNRLENAGVTVQLLERGSLHGREQGVDQALQTAMLRDGFDYNGNPGTAVMLTGDGAGFDDGVGFHADLERMRRRGWRMEVLSWRHSCNRRMREWAEASGTFVTLDDFYDSVTFLENPCGWAAGSGAPRCRSRRLAQAFADRSNPIGDPMATLGIHAPLGGPVACFVVAALALPYQTAMAANEAAVQQKMAEVAMGVTLGILFHELGHAMIGELELSVTGPEEDAADEFSVMVMSQLTADKTDPHSLYVRVAAYSSLLWYYWALEERRTGQPIPWHGEHASHLRRFDRTSCRLYGSNPPVYSWLVNHYGPNSLSVCKQDYPKKLKAWEDIIEPAARHLGPDSPGAHSANTWGGVIGPIFQPSKSEYQWLAKHLFDEVLTDVFDELNSYLMWPREVLVEFKDCGINASYDPNTGRITMCYEMIKHGTELVLRHEGIDVAPRDPAMSFLQGAWWARIGTEYGPLDVTITYHPNGAFQIDEIWAQTGDLAARVGGTWSAESAGNQFLIRRLPQQWLPQDFCYYSQAACRGAQATSRPAQVVDRNAMSVDGVVWQRTQ